MSPAMSRTEIVAKIASKKLSPDVALAMLNAMEEPGRNGQLYCKVSEKCAVSVYGLQRLPVTLYADQWERLLNFSEQLKKFLIENHSKLSRKGDTSALSLLPPPTKGESGDEPPVEAELVTEHLDEHRDIPLETARFLGAASHPKLCWDSLLVGGTEHVSPIPFGSKVNEIGADPHEWVVQMLAR